MPALLTKMSSGPKISALLVTAARSSSAEALSAFKASALPPPDSTSCTSFRAFSSELEKVNATDAPSEASRRTMPAPMPFEPPVTRATLPVNDFSCTATMNILRSSPTPILDGSIQNKIPNYSHERRCQDHADRTKTSPRRGAGSHLLFPDAGWMIGNPGSWPDLYREVGIPSGNQALTEMGVYEDLSIRVWAEKAKRRAGPSCQKYP